MEWRNASTDPPPTNVTQLVKLGGSFYFAALSAYQEGVWYDVHGRTWMKEAPTHWLDPDRSNEVEKPDPPRIFAPEQQLFLDLE